MLQCGSNGYSTTQKPLKILIHDSEALIISLFTTRFRLNGLELAKRRAGVSKVNLFAIRFNLSNVDHPHFTAAS